MSAHRTIWSWSPATPESRSAALLGLEDRLSESARDRAANATAVVREAALELHAWVSAQRSDWSFEEAGAELEEGWKEWVREQAWRGPCAIFVDAIRRAFEHARMRGAEGGPQELLREELQAWLNPWVGYTGRWDGAPLARAPRLAKCEEVAPHALRTLSERDWILVHGYSETVLQALFAAQRGGRFPQVLLSEGGPDHSGKRMARELATQCVHVRLGWDAAVLGRVDEADRIWLGTEAIGAGAFLGLVGTGLLLEEAERAEVPVAVLCTGDELMPGGETLLPSWGEEESWNLWSDGPDGTELAPQPYERVDTDRVPCWLTDAGPGRLSDLCLRSLRPVAAPPCTG